MYGNFAYVYVCVPHARSECLKKPEEGVRYPGPGVPGVRDLHVSAGRPKPSPRLPLPLKITVSLQSIACVRTESLCYRRKTVYHSFIIGRGWGLDNKRFLIKWNAQMHLNYVLGGIRPVKRENTGVVKSFCAFAIWHRNGQEQGIITVQSRYGLIVINWVGRLSKACLLKCFCVCILGDKDVPFLLALTGNNSHQSLLCSLWESQNIQQCINCFSGREWRKVTEKLSWLLLSVSPRYYTGLGIWHALSVQL